ncbi:MAG: transcriptional regulator [Aestuariivirgaceae bacterium]
MKSIARIIVATLFLGLPTQLAAAELVMVEQHACEWCEAWNEDVGVVYDKTMEGKSAPLRRIDIHDPLPGDLQFITGLVYTPTFVLVDGGKEIGRIRGYPGEDFFWGLLQQLVAKLN